MAYLRGFTVAVFSLLGILVYGSPTGPVKPLSAFSYNATDFLLHGETYQIIGGQMDPQRIPYQYWSDRLAKARALGLNTILSYVLWNELAPSPNEWTLQSNPQNNIAEFFRLAQQEGLHVVLRPGPYICGEREFGGFPYWLSEVPGLTVRANNPPFLQASDKYLEKLSQDLAPLLVSNGGPILMVQVENEYGSYGDDHAYTLALKNQLNKHFPGATLYTNDGGVQADLDGGMVEGVLAEADGGPEGAFNALRMYRHNSSLGPLLDGEYYTDYPDQWGPKNKHVFPSDADVAGYVKDIDYALGSQEASMSLYMVHGGTNFGFSNGALWSNKTQAWTSSYDYGAPIDEAGRKQFYYDTIRKTMTKYSPEGSIPEPANDIPMMELPAFELQPAGPMWNNRTLSKPTATSIRPLTMEALGQAYGFILYTHKATKSCSGILSPGDGARDRVIIYVNGVYVGIIDSQYSNPPPVNVTLKPEDELSILVENLGRVNYYSRMSNFSNHIIQPHKGIVGDVKIGDDVLQHWEMLSLPVADGKSVAGDKENKAATTLPTYYTGSFEIPNTVNPKDGCAGMDTYLAVPNGIRGEVYVNGFHLGRYWLVGPQQSLYLPGTFLHPDASNEVVVLELEPNKLADASKMEVQGLSKREWFNRPDPDCERCT